MTCRTNLPSLLMIASLSLVRMVISTLSMLSKTCLHFLLTKKKKNPRRVQLRRSCPSFLAFNKPADSCINDLGIVHVCYHQLEGTYSSGPSAFGSAEVNAHKSDFQLPDKADESVQIN